MNPIYTPARLQLFIGATVKCCGSPTWTLHGKNEILTAVLMQVLAQDEAISWVKPILRSLQDMTDDEATRIAKLCLDITDNHFQHALVLRHADDEIIIKVDYTSDIVDGISKDFVTIPDDFYIYHDHDFYAPNNQPEIFQYLVEHSFDIFGWIKQGIALDKTKNQ